MRTFALDSNILIYAELEARTEKGRRAAHLIGAMPGRDVLSAQAIGEFLTVVRRRGPPVAFENAQRQAVTYRKLFEVVPTSFDTLLAAAAFTQRYNLQFWDAVIWQASASAGASILFGEDMQDGFSVGGMSVVNPLVLDDAALQGLLGR